MIVSDAAYGSGMRRRISIEGGAIEVTHTRDGVAAGRVFIPAAYIALIAEASSRTEDRVDSSVGEVPMKGGAAIEIGAGFGALTFRVRRADGELCKMTKIHGAELILLCRAIDDLVSR